MKTMKISKVPRTWVVVGTICAAILGSGAGAAWGQSNHEINGAIQFNFGPPGARSLAMGGAFIGRADDATAAYTNPAGLIWLSKPEVAIEGRHTSFETVFFNGRYDGTPTGVGLDTVDGLNTMTQESNVSNLSFISIAIPVGQNYRLAFYRHELANVQASIDDNERAFYHATSAGAENMMTSRANGQTATIDLDVVDYGLSAAFRFTERFWGGVGLIYRDFKTEALTRGYSAVNDDGSLNFSSIDFSVGNQRNSQYQSGEDTEYSYSLGLFFKSKNEKWTGGFSYQHSSEFNYDLKTYTRGAGPPCTGDPCGTILDDLTGEGTFTIPKVYGVGVSFSPTASFMVSVQYNHVTYSDLAPDQNSLGEVLTWGDYIYLSDFVFDDADELHLGFEYVILGKTPIALRFGGWYDPDHQLYYKEANRASAELDPTNQAALDEARKRIEIRFPGGDDQFHYTGGIGAVFGSSFQVEAGFDISDRSTIYSLSAVVRF